MHEVSIMQNVIEIVLEKAKENKFKTIKKVSLKIGDFSGVMEDSLRFAFQAMKKEGMLEKAELHIDGVKATAECSHCNLVFEIERFNKLCPNCQTFCSSIVTGYELYIDTIEGDN